MIYLGKNGDFFSAFLDEKLVIIFSWHKKEIKL
jgi:hypothetical protein